jgi:hypothetical protein
MMTLWELPAYVVANGQTRRALRNQLIAYRNHSQRKSHAGNSAQSVRLSRPLEHRIIVELNVVRKPKLAPCFRKALVLL